MEFVHAGLPFVDWKDVAFALLRALDLVAEVLPNMVEQEATMKSASWSEGLVLWVGISLLCRRGPNRRHIQLQRIRTTII